MTTTVLYRKRKSLGLCPICGKSRESENKLLCDYCADRQQQNSKKYWIQGGDDKRNALRAEKKRAAVEYLGGQCVDCGLKINCLSVYDFDHRPGAEKRRSIRDNSVGIDLDWPWEVIQAELDKCDLRCANCHRLRHSQERGGCKR